MQKSSLLETGADVITPELTSSRLSDADFAAWILFTHVSNILISIHYFLNQVIFIINSLTIQIRYNRSVSQRKVSDTKTSKENKHMKQYKNKHSFSQSN